MKAPKIFILSGPGGAGKTTLINRLFRKEGVREIFTRAITVTTRPKRPQEKDGQDYFFVSKEEFLWLKEKNFFLEYQKILDDYYGTPKLFYALAEKKNKNLILCIDVKGGRFLKRNCKTDKITTIFIATSTPAELCRRMKKRAEDKEMVERRIELAKKELQFSKYYDYLIINKNINTALKELENIIFGKDKTPRKK